MPNAESLSARGGRNSIVSGPVLLLAVIFNLSACQLVDNRIRGRITEPGSPPPPTTDVTVTLAVEAAYPQNGARWNDYVENSEEQFHQASDVACNGDGYVDGGSYDSERRFGWDACLHAGEIRKVLVPGAKTCGSLSLTDDLSVFDWICDATGGTVKFFSRGLKSDKGLKDLLLANSWKDNRVVISGVSGGITYSGSSPLARWWTNPVVPLPDNSTGSALDLDGVDDDGGVPGDGSDEAYAERTLFTYDSNRTTMGYRVGLPGVAIVGLDESVLTLAAAANGTMNCKENRGSASFDSLCVVSVDSQPYFWLEGSFDGNAVNGGFFPRNIYFIDSPFWRGRGISTTRAGSGSGLGIRIEHSDFGQLDGLLSHSNGSSGFLARNSYCRFARLRVSGHSSNGLGISGSPGNSGTGNLFYDVESQRNSRGLNIEGATAGNTFVKLKVSNNTNEGIRLYSFGGEPAQTILTNLLVFNNGTGAGVEITGQQNIVHHLSSLHNNSIGFRLNASLGGAFSQILIAKSGTTASARSFEMVSASNSNIIAQYASYGSYNYEIGISASYNSFFQRNLLVGNSGNLNCSVGGGSGGNNLTNGGASCGPGDPANDLTIQTSLNLAASGALVDAPVISDPANGGNNLIQLGAGVTNPSLPGVVNFPQITDWSLFSSFFRGWAKGQNPSFWANDGGNNVGACSGAADCVLRDFRLRNTIGNPILNTSFDGVNQNTVFVAGTPCPDAVDGDLVMENIGFTYLLNALEIMEDGLGNENGLCESKEACIYSPNFGAYQGEGDPYSQGTCQFTNGRVKNVKMYAYPINGI